MVKVNDLVKWPVTGGSAIGKVVKITDETIDISTPLGQSIELNINEAKLEVIDEDGYNAEIRDVANTLLEKIGEGNLMSQEQINELNDQVKALETQVAEITSERDAVKTELDASKAELEKIQREQLIESRFNQLSDLEATDIISDNEDEVRASLAEMTDVHFTSILKAAQKMTEVRQSSLLAGTDQDNTTEVNSTEAVDNAEEEEVETDTVTASMADGNETAEKRKRLTSLVEGVLQFSGKSDAD